VGCCGAVGVLDWGGATAAAAGDGDQEGQRKSAEEMSSGKENVVKTKCGKA
jgi:hypothetical protein